MGHVPGQEKAKALAGNMGRAVVSPMARIVAGVAVPVMAPVMVSLVV